MEIPSTHILCLDCSIGVSPNGLREVFNKTYAPCTCSIEVSPNGLREVFFIQASVLQL